MVGRFNRLSYLPVGVATAYSAIGVLFLRWSVADLFFWFWSEFVMAGIITVALMEFYLRKRTEIPVHSAGITRFGAYFSFLLILFYATLFAAMAFKGEWGTWERFPEFLRNKWIGLLATAIAFLTCTVMALVSRSHWSQVCNDVFMQYNRKALVIAVLYGLMLLHGWIREWTTGGQFELSSAYLKMMGLLLLSIKVPIEGGLLDGWFKRRRSSERQAF